MELNYNETKKNMYKKKRDELHKKYLQKQKFEKIDQYDLNGIFIKTWNSCMEIKKCLCIGNNQISRVCRFARNRNTAGEYIWKYHDDKRNNDMEKKNKITKYTINQINKKGEIIKCWKSASEASRELNIIRSKISRVCNGKIDTAGGFTWKYVIPK